MKDRKYRRRVQRLATPRKRLPLSSTSSRVSSVHPEQLLEIFFRVDEEQTNVVLNETNKLLFLRSLRQLRTYTRTPFKASLAAFKSWSLTLWENYAGHKAA